MIWQSLNPRVWLLIDGESTEWRIFSYGMSEPYRYELWHADKYNGSFESLFDAQQRQKS